MLFSDILHTFDRLILLAIVAVKYFKSIIEGSFAHTKAHKFNTHLFKHIV